MKSVVSMTIEGDTVLAVEVHDEPVALNAGRAGLAEVVAETAAQTFDEALDRIRPIANAIVKRIRSIDIAPAEVSVKFGLKFSASAGVILSSTAAEANLEFNLKWTPKATDDA